MDDSTKAVLTGFARHGLTAAAGVLAAHGLAIDDGTLSLLAAAIVGLAGCLWSAFQKKGIVAL